MAGSGSGRNIQYSIIKVIRVFWSYPDPVFEMRSDPVSKVWSDSDPVFKTWSDLDPGFKNWSDPDPGKPLLLREHLNSMNMYRGSG